MGVAVGRFPVGGPAGVGDADAAGHRLLPQLFREGRHLAPGTHPLQAAPVVTEHGQAGGVVATVLQAPQAFEKNRDHVPLGDRPDDAAHVTPLPCRASGAAASPRASFAARGSR